MGSLFSLEADGKTASTRRYYEEPLRRFLAYASERGWAGNLASITTSNVRPFLSHASSATYSYTAGNGTRLIRHGRQGGAWQYFRALRRLFNWAQEEGIISDTPMRRFRYKSPRTPRADAYSQDAIARLLSVCDLDIRTGARFLGLRNRAMLLLFFTPLRSRTRSWQPVRISGSSSVFGHDDQRAYGEGGNAPIADDQHGIDRRQGHCWDTIQKGGKRLVRQAPPSFSAGDLPSSGAGVRILPGMPPASGPQPIGMPTSERLKMS